MSKWIETLVCASKMVLVEVEDNDPDPDGTAQNLAGLEAYDGDFYEVSSSGEVSPERLDSMKRHAGLVIPLPL